MPIIKGGEFVEDIFVTVPDGEPLPDNAPVIVSLARFLDERDALIASGRRLGVKLKSADSPEALRNDLARIALIAIEFPIFRDGRGFSWARMLRTRLGFKGEIRAVGHILYDQLAFLVRVGFDAFEVRQDFRVEDFDRAMREMHYVYQPSADGRRTILDERSKE